MENADNDPQLDIVAQRWPDVTLDEAGRVLAALAEPMRAQEVLAHSGRPTASGSMVRTDHGDVFIKRYDRSVRDTPSILPYHRFVAHLASAGMPCPAFLEFDEHAAPGALRTTLAVGPSVYEVCPRADGEDRYADALTWDPPRSLAEAEGLGALLARIALAAASFDEPRPESVSPFQDRFGLFASDDLDAALEEWLAQRPSVARYLKDTHRDLRRDLAEHRRFSERISGAYRQLPSCWTHGDPHVSNFLWRGDAPSAAFDFGLADRNAAVFDLVEALERNAIQFVQIMNGDDTACRPDIAGAIIRGYQRVRPLGDNERALVADMLPVAQAEASLTWIGYYADGTGRADDAAWCYDVSLIAHTAWFFRPAGRAFLDAVRAAL